MLKHFYIPRPGDNESITKYTNVLMELGKEDLIRKYNREVSIGIVGVHQQALMLIALRSIFLLVFGDSPIIFEEDIYLSLSGKAKLVDGKLVYEIIEES